MSIIAVEQLRTLDGSVTVNVEDIITTGGLSEIVYNVKSAGVVTGDGVTDDTNGLNAALQAGAGGIVFFPAGTYSISNYLRIPSNTTVYLSGGATVLRGSSSLTSMFINDADGTTGGYTANKNITICGKGTIDGNAAYLASSCTLVSFGHATDVAVKDITLKNVGGRWHAIEFNAVLRGLASGLTIDTAGVPSDNYNEAIQIDNAATSGKFPFFGPYDDTHCQHITVENCYISSFGCGVGSHDPSSASKHFFITVKNCKMFINTIGIKPMNWSGVKFVDNYIEKQSNDAVTGIAGIYVQNNYAGGTNSDILISGNSIRGFVPSDTSGDPGAYWRGIWIDGNSSNISDLSNIVIEKNQVQNTWGHGYVISNSTNVILSGNNHLASLSNGSTSDKYSYYLFQSADTMFSGNVGKSPIYLGGGSSASTRVVCTGNMTQSYIYYNSTYVTRGAIVGNYAGGTVPGATTGALVIQNNGTGT